MTKQEQLEAIKYSRGSLKLLDQRLLPLQQEFLDIKTCEDAHARIKEMAVRGAPAIAIAGFLALAVELHNAGAGAQFSDAAHASQVIQEKSEYLVTRYWAFCEHLHPHCVPHRESCHARHSMYIDDDACDEGLVLILCVMQPANCCESAGHSAQAQCSAGKRQHCSRGYSTVGDLISD